MNSHGAVISSRIRNGARIYQMLSRYEVAGVLHLVIPCYITVGSGQRILFSDIKGKT